MKIRISHFYSAILAFVLALIFFLGAPLFIHFVKSDSAKTIGADEIALLYFLFYLGFGVFLFFSLWEAKYYILSEEGIRVCILGICCCKIKWETIFDVMIGPDPHQRYTSQTLLLNTQPGKKYSPNTSAVPSMYEKAFYKDYYRGKIICLRCEKKLNSVLALLNEYVSEDVMQQLRRF